MLSCTAYTCTTIIDEQEGISYLLFICYLYYLGYLVVFTHLASMLQPGQVELNGLCGGGGGGSSEPTEPPQPTGLLFMNLK